MVKATTVQKIYVLCAQEPKSISLSVDHKFWTGLQFLYELFTPILKWITILEANGCHLNLVTKAFSDIMQTCQNHLVESPLALEEDEQIIKFITNRRKFVLHSIHSAANLLDPKLNGENLSRDEQLKGHQFIFNRIEHVYGNEENLISEIQKDFAEYRSSRGLYSKSFVKSAAKSSDPITWWVGMFCGTELSSIPADILSMPASTAATERSFSAYGNIHSIKRNRLTTTKAGKLAYVSHNLKLLNSSTRKKQMRIDFACSSGIDKGEENNCTESESGDLEDWSDSDEDSYKKNSTIEAVELFDSDDCT